MGFDAPFFDLDPQMVVLDSFERRRWDKARTTAAAAARNVASKVMVVLEDKIKTGELGRYVEDLAAFAARGTA